MWSRSHLELTSSLSRQLSCVAKGEWAKEFELIAICKCVLHTQISEVVKVELSTRSSGLCHASPGAGLRKRGLDAKSGHGSALEEPAHPSGQGLRLQLQSFQGQVHSGLSVSGREQHELGEDIALTEFLLCTNVLIWAFYILILKTSTLSHVCR